MKKLLPYIVDRIKKSDVKYEVHSFDSGAIMVDIWIDNNFYVIQIDGETIGLSLITKETTPFDIIPDQTFTDDTLFKNAFDDIFHNIGPRTLTGQLAITLMLLMTYCEEVLVFTNMKSQLN